MELWKIIRIHYAATEDGAKVAHHEVKPDEVYTIRIDTQREVRDERNKAELRPTS